ncbi:MAG: uL15 family ribosomal protein, partial [Brevibacterium aurantiacum]
KNPAKVTFQVVNLDKLSALYPEGGDVTVADLVAKGAVRPKQPVKVLGTGEITVALNITADKVSGSALEKIKAAGGSVSEA